MSDTIVTTILFAVNNELTQTLPISTLFNWISIIANNVKRNLEEHLLQQSMDYKESVDLVMNNQELEDYSMVIDTQPLDYKADDGGNQKDPILHSWCV